MTRSRHPQWIVSLIALVTIVSACGQMPGAETPTPVIEPSPAATSAPAGTAVPEVTLGDLANRSNEAWSGVRSFRIRFTGRAGTVSGPAATPASGAAATPGAVPIASPGATPMAAFVSVRDVMLPDEQRQTVSGLGETDHEAIVSGDRLYLRGPLVRQIFPGMPADAWIAIDPNAVPEESALSHLLGGLPAVPAAPLSSLPERLWPQVVRDLGTVAFDQRQCEVFGAADTIPTTGSRIDYTIALDQSGLPCFIETSAGGVSIGRDEYLDINAPLTIGTPAAATPVSVPPALTSPVPRD